MGLAAVIGASITALLEGTVDIGVVKHDVGLAPQAVLSDGNGASQANKLWTDQRTLGASASENLDLNGVLVDAIGAALAFTKVRALLIVADGGNTNDVVLGGAAANGFFSMFNASTEKLKIKPGGFALLAAPSDANGYAVVAGTGDQLMIANGGAGTPVTYKIVVVGS